VSEKSMEIDSYKGRYYVDFCEDGVDRLISNLPNNNFHLIIDQRVASIYKKQLGALLKHKSVLQIEAIETNKSLEIMPEYVSHLVAKNLRRDDVLIAIGGGIIQDITCFLAATMLRGVDWYFYPTTLLAQADSCIGSKSSINCGDSKNLLGTFTPPNKVIIGSDFLNTLDEKDIRSGVGEMLKVHGIAGKDKFDDISSKYHQLFLDNNVMQTYIHSALEIKKKYIEIDEFDKGVRNIFNYGHSLGHAIESATSFAIPHGIAVTIGLDMANWLSPQIGSGDYEHYHRMHNVLAQNYRGFENVEIPLGSFMSALAKDKKNIGEGEVTLILPNKEAKIEKGRYVNDDFFSSLCNEYLTKMRLQ
tara:strand:- start:26313 stop:27392 length:1080 start_codon:yes stop_codon:yes gene_type:complete